MRWHGLKIKNNSEGGEKMPKVTITAHLPFPPAAVWRRVTDLENYSWRGDVGRIEAGPGGRTFVEYTRDGFPTKFIVTAFAPCRWYAFDMVNANFTGRWEGLFVPAEGGTRIEFTEEVHPYNPLLRLAAGIYLRRQQRRYIADLRRSLEEG